MTDSKKKRTRRSFSVEFKREAVALFQVSGVSAEQAMPVRSPSTSSSTFDYCSFAWSVSSVPFKL